MSFDISGLRLPPNIRLRPIVRVSYTDKMKHGRELMNSNLNYLLSDTFTDMTFFTPLDNRYMKVSFSYSIWLSLLLL